MRQKRHKTTSIQQPTLSKRSLENAAAANVGTSKLVVTSKVYRSRPNLPSFCLEGPISGPLQSHRTTLSRSHSLFWAPRSDPECNNEKNQINAMNRIVINKCRDVIYKAQVLIYILNSLVRFGVIFCCSVHRHAIV